jgi:hypothetical protein
MPKCLRCGNIRSFGSSRLPTKTPWVNGAPSALLGDFSGEKIKYMENMGTSWEVSQEAFAHPEKYFDLCLVCGSW